MNGVVVGLGALVAEDGPVEMVSAMLFFAAGGLAALAALAGRLGRGILTPAVAIVATLCGLDELSFGQRQLGWTPYAIAGVPIDGAHDLLSVALRLLQWSPVWMKAAVLACALAAGAAAVALALRYRAALAAAWRAADRPSLTLAAAAAAAVATAQALDLGLAPLSSAAAISAAEESLEVTASALALAVVWRRIREAGRATATPAVLTK